MDKKRIFMSYSRHDISCVTEMSGRLSKIGEECFIAQRDIEWGQILYDRVIVALENCVAVIAVLSPGSVKSAWVLFEIGYATALHKEILPFLTHPELDVPDCIRYNRWLPQSDIGKVVEFFQSSYWEQCVERNRRKVAVV